MATLLKDDAGIPIPQYQNALGEFEPSKGAEGAFNVNDAQIATLISRVETIQNDVTAIKTVLGTLPNGNASTVYDLLDAIHTSVSANGVYLDNISDAIGTVGTGDSTALSILADMLTALGTLVAALASGGTFSNIASDVNTITTQATAIATDTGNIAANTGNIVTTDGSIASDVADIKVSAANIDANTTPSNS